MAFTAAISLVAAACGDAPAAGAIAVPLVASASDGSVYRLRDGHFKITDDSAPGAVIGLSTEDDPDATELHAELSAGGYVAQLDDGWRLERGDGSGGFAPIAATLVSVNPVPFTVADGATTRVAFVFRVAGADVVLGGGLDVEIEVYTACDPAAQTGCAAGERCTQLQQLDGSHRTTCTTAGTIPEDGACTAPTLGADDCVAGTVCMGGTCRATCRFTDTACPCFGGAFTDTSDFGYCETSCDPLAQDCTDAGEACYFTPAFAVCARPTVTAGQPGAPCLFVNQCVEGSVCVAGGDPLTDGPGCGFICAVSGAGPTCAGGPGAGFTCVPAGTAVDPDVGICVDCTAQPWRC